MPDHLPIYSEDGDRVEEAGGSPGLDNVHLAEVELTTASIGLAQTISAPAVYICICICICMCICFGIYRSIGPQNWLRCSILKVTGP